MTRDRKLNTARNGQLKENWICATPTKLIKFPAEENQISGHNAINSPFIEGKCTSESYLQRLTCVYLSTFIPFSIAFNVF